MEDKKVDYILLAAKAKGMRLNSSSPIFFQSFFQNFFQTVRLESVNWKKENGYTKQRIKDTEKQNKASMSIFNSVDEDMNTKEVKTQ